MNNLNTMNVQELSVQDSKEVNGGAEYMSWYGWGNTPGNPLTGVFVAVGNAGVAIGNAGIWIWNQF